MCAVWITSGHFYATVYGERVTVLCTTEAADQQRNGKIQNSHTQISTLHVVAISCPSFLLYDGAVLQKIRFFRIFSRYHLWRSVTCSSLGFGLKLWIFSVFGRNVREAKTARKSKTTHKSMCVYVCVCLYIGQCVPLMGFEIVIFERFKTVHMQIINLKTQV